MLQVTNRIIDKLRQGETAAGVNVQLGSPEIVELVARAGYDYAMIDWEHGSFGFDTVVTMIRAADAGGLTSIVRIPNSDSVHIKKVLDAGAKGIVVPQVSSYEEALTAINAAYYFDGTNTGTRGACPTTRAAGHFASDWKAYAEKANQNVMVAISVECEKGLAIVPDVCRIPGLSAIFLGSFDLAQSMGLHGDMRHPQVKQSVETLVKQCQAANVPVFATLVSTTSAQAEADARYWKETGAGILNCVSDRRVLYVGLSDRLADVRRGLDTTAN